MNSVRVQVSAVELGDLGDDCIAHQSSCEAETRDAFQSFCCVAQRSTEGVTAQEVGVVETSIVSCANGMHANVSAVYLGLCLSWLLSKLVWLGLAVHHMHPICVQ